MLVARRPLPIGEYLFAPGESLTREALALLPAGRVGSLLSLRMIEEVPDDTAMMREVDDLRARVAVLEDTVAALEPGG